MSSIKKNGKWDADLYDTKHHFVSEYGNSLIELLQPQKGENILDLGCGTGDLANTITSSGAEVIGVDMSEDMLVQAAKKYPHIKFDQQNATELTFSNEFDAVFSNATLHWVKQPVPAIEGIYRSLKQGGRFVAEFGGKDNVKQICDGIIRQVKKAGYTFYEDQLPWYYPSIAEYTTLLEAAGFRVTRAEHYDRPTPLDGDDGLKNWILMFCDMFFEHVPEDAKPAIIDAIDADLRETLFIDGVWYADYKRLRVVAVKE